jgi:hypothetical protein
MMCILDEMSEASECDLDLSMITLDLVLAEGVISRFTFLPAFETTFGFGVAHF